MIEASASIPSLSATTRSSRIWKRRACPALDVTVDMTASADHLIRHHLWSIGFMGAGLFELQSWRPVPSGVPSCRNRSHGTYYAHVGHIVEMLERPDRPVRILGAPLVANRAVGPESFTWRTDALGVFFGFEGMCAIASSIVRRGAGAGARRGRARLSRKTALPVHALDGPDACRRHHGAVELPTPSAPGSAADCDPSRRARDGADSAWPVPRRAGHQAVDRRSQRRRRVTTAREARRSPDACRSCRNSRRAAGPRVDVPAVIARRCPSLQLPFTS